MRTKEKIQLYESLNRVFQVYPPTVFQPRFFATEEDKQPEGSPKEKKRTREYNRRQRNKRMVKVLDERISYMTGNEAIFMAEFEPIFNFSKEDEEEINQLA